MAKPPPDSRLYASLFAGLPPRNSRPPTPSRAIRALAGPVFPTCWARLIGTWRRVGRHRLVRRAVVSGGGRVVRPEGVVVGPSTNPSTRGFVIVDCDCARSLRTAGLAWRRRLAGRALGRLRGLGLSPPPSASFLPRTIGGGLQSATNTFGLAGPRSSWLRLRRGTRASGPAANEFDLRTSRRRRPR